MPPEFQTIGLRSLTPTKSLNINRTKRLENFLRRSLRNNPIAKDLNLHDETQNPYDLMNERLTTATIKEVEEGTALRVRLFVSSYQCDRWDQQDRTKTFFCGLPSVDFFDEPHREVLYQLKNSKFIGYASVVVMVHRYSLLLSIMEAMKDNKFLRYKSKLILCRYNYDFAYGTNVPMKLAPQRQSKELAEISSILAKVSGYIHKASSICITLPNTSGGRQTNNRYPKLSEDCGEIDNTILVQWFDEDSFSGRYGYALILYAILMQPYASFKETVRETFKGSFVSSTSQADLYAYSINPALAIIVNNYYFTTPHSLREGSDRDVINLIRELKIAGIPYILAEDCSSRDLQKILDYLETKDFSPLKSFLFFLMSHGDSDDIVYTHDGQMNIQTDIVNRILANATLKDVEKLLAIIKCRGEIDVENTDEDELPQFPATDDSNLDQKTVVLYSVPQNVKSPRDREMGCPFITSFCQHFRNISHTEDIREVDRKIDEDLKDVDYFYGLEKCTEVVVRDHEQCHNIIQEPVNIEKVLRMLKSIFEDFPLQDTNSPIGPAGGSSFICSVLNTDKFEKEDVIRKYFASELESDTFSVMSDI